MRSRIHSTEIYARKRINKDRVPVREVHQWLSFLNPGQEVFVLEGTIRPRNGRIDDLTVQLDKPYGEISNLRLDVGGKSNFYITCLGYDNLLSLLHHKQIYAFCKHGDHSQVEVIHLSKREKQHAQTNA